MKYLVEKLNGVEVEMVHGAAAGKGYVNVVLSAEGAQEMFAVPHSWLTPIAPPTPEEPPPGAYQIGDVMVVRFALDKDPKRCWNWATEGEGWDYGDWDEVWERFGGPDVSIQRLVPEPAKVELPWTNGPFAVAVRDDASQACSVVLTHTFRGADMVMTPSRARRMAAALWTAAGES